MNNQWKCYYCETELEEGKECNCEKSKEQKGYITSNAVKSEKGYKCACGNDRFRQTGHMDFSTYYSTTYKCSECENCIGVQFDRSEESMAYWE